MAKPQLLQNLTHDLLLTKSNFPTFVETYNYTVNRCDNLKGDADFSNGGGHIQVDNTDPEHPIIRYVGNDENGGGSGDANAVVELSAGSENENAQIDAENQDWLKYVKADGTETKIGLPYINAVKELSISADANGDKSLGWTYTRTSAIGGPEDLGIEFASGQNTTNSHSKFYLASASDSNVQFTLNGQTIQIGVYYV